jgi:hypothetical protein
MIRFACPHCKTRLKASLRQSGKEKACPACGQRLQVPAPARNQTVLGQPTTPNDPTTKGFAAGSPPPGSSLESGPMGYSTKDKQHNRAMTSCGDVKARKYVRLGAACGSIVAGLVLLIGALQTTPRLDNAVVPNDMPARTPNEPEPRTKNLNNEDRKQPPPEPKKEAQAKPEPENQLQPRPEAQQDVKPQGLVQVSLVTRSRLLGRLAKVYAEPKLGLWAARLKVKNCTNRPLRGYRVRFQVAGYSPDWTEWQRQELVDAGRTVVNYGYPVLDVDKLALLEESRWVHVKAQYQYRQADGRLIDETESRRVELLGHNLVESSSKPYRQGASVADRKELPSRIPCIGAICQSRLTPLDVPAAESAGRHQTCPKQPKPRAKPAIPAIAGTWRAKYLIGELTITATLRLSADGSFNFFLLDEAGNQEQLSGAYRYANGTLRFMPASGDPVRQEVRWVARNTFDLISTNAEGRYVRVA